MFNCVLDMTLNQQPGVSLLRGGAPIFSPLFNSIVRLFRLHVTFNISGHIATVPACSTSSNDRLFIVLPHWNALPRVWGMAPRSHILYSRGIDQL